MSFWHDNWIKNCSLIEILELSENNIPSPDIKVSKFIQQDMTWNLPKLIQTLSNHPIVKKIQGIAIPINSIEDSFCWGLNSSGNFSTKSATWIAHDTHPQQLLDWDYKWIWNMSTMPKIKIFL